LDVGVWVLGGLSSEGGRLALATERYVGFGVLERLGGVDGTVALAIERLLRASIRIQRTFRTGLVLVNGDLHRRIGGVVVTVGCLHSSIGVLRRGRSLGDGPESHLEGLVVC
jgi:hypothetical protein